MGRTELDTWEYLSARVPLPSFEESLAAVDLVRFRLYDAELRAFPDAAEAVRALAMQGHPVAVASSSRIAEVHRKLDQVGLSRYFQAMVGGDEVAAGKPAPDVYLAAAHRLGVDPAHCLAIEDSDVGAVAAESAGMRVVLILRDGSVHATRSTVSSLDAELLTLLAG
jgi:HAD superfamily hydrolase (TIGR01509 family)